jgi:23S rRNA (adenine2503-C2)-methyltransferase
MEKYLLPTGYLFVDQYSRGKLETLSIGDYGKRHNVKADFLGYTRELNGVPNGDIAPLSEKWVITLSVEYGCRMKCTFCDVPNVKYGGIASFDDLKQQLYRAIALFPKVTYTERLNVHFARMGDSTFNENVLAFSEWMYKNKLTIKKDSGLSIETLHPVFTTMWPKKDEGRLARDKVHSWVDLKNNVYNGQAGLQLSVNSTDEAQRTEMFRGMQTSLVDIAAMCKALPEPIGRKYCLNFAYASGNIVDGEYLATLFDPKKWMCKITPIHNNNACRSNNIETVDGYGSYLPYKGPEEKMKSAGFDVLVFVPSQDEENAIITCGNAILGGSTLRA